MDNLEISSYLNNLGSKARGAAEGLKKLGKDEINELLRFIAAYLLEHKEIAITANEKDMQKATEKGLSKGLLDRLFIDGKRMEAITDGMVKVSELPSPLGQVLETIERPNGLIIQKVSEPMGVVGMIYEARPNVTCDAFALCFKTQNAVILKGGSDAFYTNCALTEMIQNAISEYNVQNNTNVDIHVIQHIEHTEREVTKEFMHLKEYVDVLIPRGGAGLIKSVVNESSIPVIETGSGNCHVFVDKSADFEMAVKIIENAKTQRVGVCNACESILVHEAICDEFIPLLCKMLAEHNVEVRLEPKLMGLHKDAMEATEADYATEYLDYIVCVKSVKDVEEAIRHINKYNTGHSESIVSSDEQNIEKFMDEVDAACVYSNASTRFTDGFEFGFGAEIGISTQKLHARGPMGLWALTTYKYKIKGQGQVRS